MAYHLHLTFHTPVGVFSGHLTRNPIESQEAAQQTLDEFQANFNQGRINYLVLFNRSSEVSLTSRVLENSVMTAHVEEALPHPAEVSA